MIAKRPAARGPATAKPLLSPPARAPEQKSLILPIAGGALLLYLLSLWTKEAYAQELPASESGALGPGGLGFYTGSEPAARAAIPTAGARVVLPVGGATVVQTGAKVVASPYGAAPTVASGSGDILSGMGQQAMQSAVGLGVSAGTKYVAGEAVAVVKGLLAGGLPATGVAAFAPGAVPAAYVAADVPFAGTLALEAPTAGGGAGISTFTQPASLVKDVVSNVLLATGSVIPATTTGIGGIAGGMSAAEFAAMEGFQAATAAATEAAVVTPMLAYLAPVAALAAPIAAILETVFVSAPAAKKKEEAATEAQTAILAEAPYLVDYIAAHPFDTSFQMYWRAMGELPDAQYGAQKQQFNAAREGTPVPGMVTAVSPSIPSVQEVINVVTIQQIRDQLDARSLPLSWSPSTPQEQEAYSQWKQMHASIYNQWPTYATWTPPPVYAGADVGGGSGN